mgnify:CR=1 FL=1
MKVTREQANILRLPQGTETFQLGEALRHRRRLRRLEDLYESWGYLPAETPVFDFYDVYAPLMQSRAVGDVYRLIDREGELLMLRSDATLFLAKQLGLILQDEDLPVRVYYADTILRHQDPEDISRNEFIQTGVELIGRPDAEADAEILLLLRESLQEVGASHAVVHLGSRKIVNELSRELEGPEREALRGAADMRDLRRIQEILAGALPETARVAAAELLSFIGRPGELRDRLPRLQEQLDPAVITALQELLTLVDGLSGLLPATQLRIDLSEVGGQPYYTGVVFRAYIPGVDSEIASGGRYDELLGHFGFPAPSVGFSLLPGKVDASGAAPGSAPGAGDAVEAGDDETRLPKAGAARGASIRDRYEDARARRAAGEIVQL